MALPHGAVDWSAVCDCAISLSYSLTFGWNISSAKKEFILSSGSGFLTDINKTGARTVITNAYEARNWQLFSKNKE